MLSFPGFKGWTTVNWRNFQSNPKKSQESLPKQYLCVLWTWRRPMTVSLLECHGEYCGSMGYWGCCYDLFSPCVAKVRAVSVHLVQCRIPFWWALDFTREPYNCISAFCRWCGSAGFCGPWPWAGALGQFVPVSELVGKKVRKHVSLRPWFSVWKQLIVPSGWVIGSCPQQGSLSISGSFSCMMGECEMDRWFGASSAAPKAERQILDLLIHLCFSSDPCSQAVRGYKKNETVDNS